MRIVTIKGVKYETTPFPEDGVQPGQLLAGRNNRKVMRVVCFDGPDAVLRNVRHPDLLEAESIAGVERSYERIVLSEAR